MPTYEYECKKCEHVFEQFQSITADPLKTCPECGGVVKRLIGTGAGIIFKGSGFYQTDYRSNSYTEAAKKEKTDSSTADSKKSSDSASKDSGKSKNSSS